MPYKLKSINETIDHGAARMRDILFNNLGWDENNSSVEKTPERFMKYLIEFHQPFDARKVLGTPFDSPDSSMVIQDRIPFRMICEHHLLPATGFCAIGYVPNGKVVGLSKLARLVDSVGTEKPSLQEHINERIANLLVENLSPLGVMVVIEATHGCMNCRGVNRPGIVTRTSSIRGVYKTNDQARNEFLKLADIGRKL